MASRWGASPLPAAGHAGEGIGVGAGTGVADGMQPKPEQLAPAGHVGELAPCTQGRGGGGRKVGLLCSQPDRPRSPLAKPTCPAKYTGLDAWKHLL